MGFNTGMSEDDVEEIRREYELELGVLEKELATLRAENGRLRGHVENLEAYALDIDRRIRGKGNTKWIPLHTEEVIHDIAWFNKEALK